MNVNLHSRPQDRSAIARQRCADFVSSCLGRADARVAGLSGTFSRLRNLSGTTIVIGSLLVLAAYVLLGLPPFDANSYDRQGFGKKVQEYGSSSEAPFVNF